MEFTITVGSWNWPAVPTFIVLVYLLWDGLRPMTATDTIGGAFEGFLYAVKILVGAIIVLIAWLIWALCR